MAHLPQAIILAAGEGQRLKPFTSLKPKVMLPIANRPILSYVIEAIVRNGIRNIIIVVGYKKEQIEDYFGSGENFGAEITYITQKQQIGTAQALKVAEYMAASNFLVLAGDNIIEPSTIARISQEHTPSILVKRADSISKYGVVVARDNQVMHIIEKPSAADTNLVNTGIYSLTKDIFKFLENERDLPAALQNMISANQPLGCLETDGPWADIVYPWDILSINGAALGNLSPSISGTVEQGCIIRGPVNIGPGTVIRGNSYLVGPLNIGQGCEIGPNSCLAPSTSIGDNVTISPFAYIRNSVIGNNVNIGPGSFIQNSVIGSHTILNGRLTVRSNTTTIEVEGEYSRVTMGAMIGGHCEIEDNVVIQPGILIGNYTHIKPLKVVNESVPDRSLIF